MIRILEVPAEYPPAAGPPQDQGLDVVVLFTTPEATLRALQSAAKFSSGLSPNIRVVVPCVVPYPLALDEPQVRPNALSRSSKRFHNLHWSSLAKRPVGGSPESGCSNGRGHSHA